MNRQTATFPTIGNFYESLQLNHGASSTEVTRAFRRLAKQYHPDLAPAWMRDGRFFLRIKEAYETLSDPEKRRTYDQGLARRKFPVSPTATRAPKPATAPFNRAAAPRPGAQAASPFVHSAQLDVAAIVHIPLSLAITGGMQKVRLQKLAHAASPLRADFVMIRVPPLCLRGHRIQVPYHGHSDKSRLRAGHLNLKIEYQLDPDFRQAGVDLHTIYEVNPWDAALGGSFSIKAPGGSVAIQIPAGARHWQTLRVAGAGLPQLGQQRGDLIVCLKLKSVVALDPEQKRLWAALKRAHS
jgi:curved DNA-binding protein